MIRGEDYECPIPLAPLTQEVEYPAELRVRLCARRPIPTLTPPRPPEEVFGLEYYSSSCRYVRS